jgi:hypothetical protein
MTNEPCELPKIDLVQTPANPMRSICYIWTITNMATVSTFEVLQESVLVVILNIKLFNYLFIFLANLSK